MNLLQNLLQANPIQGKKASAQARDRILINLVENSAVKSSFTQGE
jgi:hypothetical protein